MSIKSYHAVKIIKSQFPEKQNDTNSKILDTKKRLKQIMTTLSSFQGHFQYYKI